MSVRKRGKKYEVSYRCPGHPQPFYERYDLKEEADFRDAQIKYEIAHGNFSPPTQGQPVAPIVHDCRTVSAYLEEFVQLYGLKKWGEGYLSRAEHYIEHYIDPYIGDILLKDVNAHILDNFYDTLQEKPAVIGVGQKDTGKKISLTVIEKIHTLLRKAFAQAVIWGYIPINPAINVTLPERESKPRETWNAGEVLKAITLCENAQLKLSIILAMATSMRIGEILGLKWENVEFYDESKDQSIETSASPSQIARGAVHVKMELKRCQKSSLERLSAKRRSKVYYVFPQLVKSEDDSTTCLVLKSPKTASSVRTIFFGETVSAALKEMRMQQIRNQNDLGAEYTEYGLVIAQANGRPIEEHSIRKYLNQLIQKHHLRPVVFHSLRHTSTAVKLYLSNGDVKAVQGDTGHAEASMVTDTYSFVDDLNRKQLVGKLERDFFQALNPACKDQDLVPNDPNLQKLIHLLLQRPDMIPAVTAMLEKMCA